MHALLSGETFTASLFHFIHRQIVSGYSDPKLLEMLFYTLLTMCNYDALHPSTSIPQAATDVDAFRRWLADVKDVEKTGDGIQSATGCLRDLLWREVKVQEAPQGRRVVSVGAECSREA